MSTPKPGQIRCPTCLRSTPPAAFCTQCGSPIPPSARARPRGLDRDELEERVRHRPGDAGFRRGAAADGGAGYVPFEPEPEDALAIREEAGEPPPRVDNLAPHTDPPRPPDPDLTRPIAEPLSRSWATPAEPEAEPTPEPDAAPEADDEAREERRQPAAIPPVVPLPAAGPPPAAEPEPATWQEPEPHAAADERYADEHINYPPDAYEDVPYGRPEDAYAYPYAQDDGRGGGGGSSALPIIGFVVLSVLALGVGAVLAGLLGGEEPIGQATPSPSVAASQAPSEVPSEGASTEPSASVGEETPPPNDGPVTFPDGAVLSIQPCGSSGFRDEAIGRPEEDACQVDGSSVPDGELWALVVFNGAGGDDALRVRLLSNDEVVNELELTIDSVLGGCGSSCNGLIYGAHYVDLLPGDYELELQRNDEFADRATFVVEG